MGEYFFTKNLCEMAFLLKIMKEHFGEEAYYVFVKNNGERIRQKWAKIAEEAGENSIETFIKRQFRPSGTGGTEYTVEETSSGFLFNCTKCPAYELAKQHGIIEQAFYLCCEPDPFAAEGFNPNIGFKRTKTLMQGDDYCDHFYFYRNGK